MTRLIDLSAVVPETVEVQLDAAGEEVYRLPGDLPVPDYLEISRLLERLQGEDSDAAETAFLALNEKVEGLFLEHNDVAPKLGPRQLGALVMSLYEGLADGDDDPDPPKPAKRAGTRSSSRKRTTRSRSSR